MVELSIPGGPEQLTPEWLTAALREGGALAGAQVVSMRSETIGVGQGFVGALVRLQLEYDPGESSAPVTVIAKFAARGDELREAFGGLGIYEREVRFYREFGAAVGVAVPHCYYSAFDSASGDFVLLLEDMSPAVVGDQVLGATGAQAELVIEQLALLHAKWWNSPRLTELEWLQTPADDIERVKASYGAAVDTVADQLREHPRLLELARLLVPLVEGIDGGLGRPPLTLTHGDMRLDNLFFSSQPSGALTIIDWQMVGAGRGAVDVARFIALSLTTEQRRADEKRLLETYHAALHRHGVRDYSFRRFQNHYIVGQLMQLVLLVLALEANIDQGSERGVRLTAAVIQRLEAALLDRKLSRILRALGWSFRLQGWWRRLTA